MEQENLFDSHLMSKFKIGDLVSWKHLKNEKKEYGFIEEIYVERRGVNRKFAFARVRRTDGAYEPFSLSYLTKESP
tara:strand:+ start:700 stop:927 length:228 start_codon:yes stop_codon:yes gene_type:complete